MENEVPTPTYIRIESLECPECGGEAVDLRGGQKVPEMVEARVCVVDEEGETCRS
jgi:hypothetical protein